MPDREILRAGYGNENILEESPGMRLFQLVRGGMLDAGFKQQLTF